MRKLLLAGVVLSLTACGGGTETANDSNVMVDDNMLMDENMMLDPNMSVDGLNVSANGAVDANTANMMAVDANTNAPDTNLANGL